MKKRLLFIACLLSGLYSLSAQTFSESGKKYPISMEGKQCIVNGFTPFSGMNDDKIFANAMLWAIENVSPQLRDNIGNIDIPGKNFECNLTLSSPSGSEMNNLYYCKATFRVADGKLLYRLSDIKIESTIVVMKRITPIEKLNPEKKPAHQETINDFVKSESQVLNKLFDYVTTYQSTPVTHWNDIAIGRPVKGMTLDECRLAFGKPLTIQESNNETQWSYGSSFYLFFKGGILETIIK